MRELVRGRAEHALQRLDRRVALVRREEARPVRDRARVLHRARFEVRDPDRVGPGRMDQLEGELRLLAGFINAREGAPGVRRLELRRGVALFTAERAIKPPEGVADAALPGDLEHVLAGGYVARESERRGLRFGVGLDVGDLVGAVDRRAEDLELDRVERDFPRGPCRK